MDNARDERVSVRDNHEVAALREQRLWALHQTVLVGTVGGGVGDGGAAGDGVDESEGGGLVGVETPEVRGQVHSGERLDRIGRREAAVVLPPFEGSIFGGEQVVVELACCPVWGSFQRHDDLGGKEKATRVDGLRVGY